MLAPQISYHPELAALIERLHKIGREIIAPQSDQVDREASFPTQGIEALKAQKLLSSYVPTEFGGMGLSISDVGRICEVLGTYCATTAMIFAMHQIQVACIVHHALSKKSGTDYFRNYIRDLVQNQYLLASATTELGVGGDVRSSICAPVYEGDKITLQKQAPVISYGEYADGILVTCRKNKDAGKNDQIHILANKNDFSLKKISGWDTLGFRGTCSNGFTLDVKCKAEQILPVPYSEIHSKTMHPFSHSVWSSLWLGLAIDAVHRARLAVRAEARRNPDVTPPTAFRLAELDTVLFSMRGGTRQAITEYHQALESGSDEIYSNFGFATRIANLKVTASTLVVEIVSKAMMITGIAGYRNDSQITLGRHLRDAYGAALMVNNERILGQCSAMQVALRD